MERKEDRRSRRTKKLLVQALTELMGKKSINEITVKELTNLADVNRGTFYIYYRDIYDMLEQIENSILEMIREMVAEGEEGEIVQETKAYLLKLFSYIEENQGIVRILLSENGDMNFLHRMNEVVRERSRKLWPVLRKPGESDADFEYHYSFISFGLAGLIRTWVHGGCKESREYMAELTDRMARNGLWQK